MKRAENAHNPNPVLQPWRRRVIWLVAALPAVAVLALVVVNNPFAQNLAGSGGVRSADSALVTTRGAAPDFSVRTMDGSTFHLAERGGNVNLLFFTAEGCVTCVRVLPVLTRIQQEYGAKGVDILVLNVVPGGSEQGFLKYMKAYGGGDYHYATDTGVKVAQAYQVQFLGTLVAVDPKGRIAAIWGEAVSYDQLKNAIDQLRA